MRATRMASCARFSTPRPTTTAVCVCVCVGESESCRIFLLLLCVRVCVYVCLGWCLGFSLFLFLCHSLSSFLLFLPTSHSSPSHVFLSAIFFPLPLAVIPDGPSAAQLSRMSPSERARASQSAYMLYTTFGTGAETFHPKIGVAAAAPTGPDKKNKNKKNVL
jgi:hypothetical protein